MRPFVSLRRSVASCIVVALSVWFGGCSANEADYRDLVRRSGTEIGAHAEAFNQLNTYAGLDIREVTDASARAQFETLFSSNADVDRLRTELTEHGCAVRIDDLAIGAVGSDARGYVVVSAVGTCRDGMTASISMLAERGPNAEPPVVSAQRQPSAPAAEASSTGTPSTTEGVTIPAENLRVESFEVSGTRVVSRTLDMTQADQRLQVAREADGTVCSEADGTCTTASGWGLPSRCSVCRTVAGFLISVGIRGACRWGGLTVCGRVGLANPFAGAICIPVVNIVCRVAGTAISRLTRDSLCRLVRLCR